MASWAFTNNTRDITIVGDYQTFVISKYGSIDMSVSGDVLTIVWSDNNSSLVALQSPIKKRNHVNTRRIGIDYNDVTSPTVASATALETIIQGWLDGTSVIAGDYSNIFFLMGA